MSKRVDWEKAKIEYVKDATVTMADLAERLGVHVGTVTLRASRDKWTEARDERARLLAQNVIRKSVSASAHELTKWNEQDLIAAKALRQAAFRKLQEAQKKSEGLDEHGKPKEFPLSLGEVRSAGMAFESAQRIARLALGASTSNVGQAMVDSVGELNFENLSDDELLAFRQNYASLLSQTFGTGGRGDPAPVGTPLQ